MLVACWLIGAVTFASAQTFSIRDVSPPTDNVGTAAQAVNARGNAVFLWTASLAGGAAGPIRTARYDATTDTFGAPADLVANPGGDVYFLNIVLDQAGNATAFGVRSRAGLREIVAARNPAATDQWGAFTTLMSPVPTGYDASASSPVAVVDAAGNVTVVWWQATCQSCTTYALYAARYTTGGGWTTVAIADRVWFRMTPSVAIDGSGNVLAMAARVGSGVTPLMAARYMVNSGTWIVSEGPSVNASIDFQRQSIATTTPDGRALLAFQDSFGLFGVRFHIPTGSWGLNRRPISSTIAAGNPSVVTDASGNFMAMWHTALTGSTLPRLLSRPYSWDSDTPGEEVPLPTIVFPSGGRLAIGGDGIPTAMWHDGGGQPDVIRVARYNAATGSWTGGVNITSVPSRGYLAPVGLSVDLSGATEMSWIARPEEFGRATLQATRWLAATGTPGAPGDLRASVSGNTVTLTWSAPTTGNAPTGYTLVVRTSPGGPVMTTVPIGAGLVFTATAPNGTFTVSVRATNENGAGPESPAVTLRVPEGATPPGAPTNLTGNVAGTTVSFSWSAPTSGGPVTGYVLVVGLTPGFSLPFTTVPVGAATSFAAEGAPPGTYYVRVQAQNTGGVGPPSNEVALTVAGLTVPEAPTLHTPVVSGSTVSLSWSPGGGGAPTGYTLSASLAPDGAPIATVPLGGTTASFAGVPAGTYYLRLTASNAAGTSPPSAEVSLIVP